jgi:hypothetical protein
MHSRISFLHVQYHGRSIIIYMCVRLLGFMLCRFWKSTHKVFMILVSVMSSKTLLHTTFLCNGVCQNLFFSRGMCFNMGLPFFAGTFLFFSSLLLLWFQQLSMITQWTLILGTLNILFFSLYWVSECLVYSSHIESAGHIQSGKAHDGDIVLQGKNDSNRCA